MVFGRFISQGKPLLKSMAVFWLLLLAVEAACPLLCDDGVREHSRVGVVNTVASVSPDSPSSSGATLSAVDAPESRHCSCECLCGTPILPVGDIAHDAHIEHTSPQLLLPVPNGPTPPIGGPYHPPRFV